MSREGSHETGGNHGLDQQVRGMRHNPWALSGVVKGPGSGQAWVQILSPPLTKLCDFGQIDLTSPSSEGWEEVILVGHEFSLQSSNWGKWEGTSFLI